MPAFGAAVHHVLRVGHRQGERLLGEDAAEPAPARLDGLADQVRLGVRRDGHVEDFDGLVGEQVVVGVVDLHHAALGGDGAGGGRVARGDGDRVEPGVPVRDQVAVADDEAGPGAADAPVLAAGELRQVVQRQIGGERR